VKSFFPFVGFNLAGEIGVMTLGTGSLLLIPAALAPVVFLLTLRKA